MTPFSAGPVQSFERANVHSEQVGRKMSGVGRSRGFRLSLDRGGCPIILTRGNVRDWLSVTNTVGTALFNAASRRMLIALPLR